MSLKFQLSKRISSLNLNRLTLITFLDVREVRDRLFIRGVGGGGGEGEFGCWCKSDRGHTFLCN